MTLLLIFHVITRDIQHSVLAAAPSWVTATKAWATAGLLMQEEKDALLSLELCRPHSAYSVRKMKLDGEKMNAVIRELQVRPSYLSSVLCSTFTWFTTVSFVSLCAFFSSFIFTSERLYTSTSPPYYTSFALHSPLSLLFTHFPILLHAPSTLI